jgi:hypothetical protein
MVRSLSNEIRAEEKKIIRQRAEEHLAKREEDMAKKVIDRIYAKDKVINLCPVCGSNEVINVLEHDIEVGSKRYNKVKCGKCEKLFYMRFDPRPVQDQFGMILSYQSTPLMIPLDDVNPPESDVKPRFKVKLFNQP